MNRAVLRIGTAGWSVPKNLWPDTEYKVSHLERYAQLLSAVEVNSSFYRDHQRKTYERWARSTPEGFRFSVKLPKTITHVRSLVGCETLLDRFAGEVTGLGRKLGVVLVQTPPKSVFVEETAQQFFGDLISKLKAPVALEPRNSSWFAPGVAELLCRWGVSLVAADPPPVVKADVPSGQAALRYYRWHGSPRVYSSSYSFSALRALATRIKVHNRAGEAVWVIFDNTAAGKAFANAQLLVELT